MSHVRDRRRNNVKAGVFVTLSLLLTVVVFTILTNAWERVFRSTTSYRVSFSVKEGIGTLDVGSQVRLGGVLIGEVTVVIPRVENGIPTSLIDVWFEINERYTLYDNATIHARSGLLGASAWLSITNVGNGLIASANTGLIGTSETMMSQLLGRDAEVNISKSLDALRRMSEVLSGKGGMMNLLLGPEEAKSINEAIASAKSGLASLEKMMGSTETVWPKWQNTVSTILKDSKALPHQVSETMQEIREAVQDIRSNILPSLEKSMASFEESMDSLKSISKTVQRSTPEWTSSITDIVDSVDLMTARAKAAIDEISASPWKLLYRPKDRDLVYEQLNAASWQLLSALSDLRKTAEIIHVASLSPDAPEEAAALSQMLLKCQQDFEEAREAILERMQIDFPER